MKPPASIGPYQVERPLGRGGMGVVYVCRHPRLPRPVAVKQVLARGADARALERFEREAALMARVRHPAIVTVHELGRTPEGPYIVMELVEGRGLDRVVRDAPMEPATAARIARDVAGALAAMHAAGVIHRDVKPQNVMLRPDGAPVLLDFGLARELAAERLTRTGEVLGTVAYMAPEQADGKHADLDGRADVYSLGALLYELLAGRPPYEGGGIQVLARLLSDEEPPPVSNAAGPPAPPALEAIVRVAMAKRREDRYPTAQALAADLGRYLEGAPPLALARARRPRRAGAVAAVAAASLVAAVAAAGVGARPAEPPETSQDTGATVVGGAAAPAPSPAPLWAVRAGEELVYRLELHEDSGGQTVRFACTLALQPREDPDAPELRFACAVTHLSCSWGFGGVAVGERYDSASSDDRHPLAFLGEAVGRPFECRVEPRSGEVVLMNGFTDIHAAVAAAPRIALRELLRGILGNEDLEPFFMRLIDVVFSDAFMRASMDALTRVVDGPDRVVPWRSAGDLVGSYAVTPGSRGPCALPSMTMDLTPGATFDYRGTSRYAAGRLEEAELQQDLVVDRGRGCSMRWSMRLVR